ncbi:LacI family DNA-binding transcriptional regulator [Paraglaciecola aquimarina]|uniref:LacI family DNA-binding transcriptional regulator n=1 Tax=Paraglaciecola aquimarina TaxID=1235557 RepID=A0ABU3STF9_9ALTE|nr:LacI family DNA-binding transcriptional regulator [Paraglaciecola aquimarina]MDU0353268.1 LacI family DNA-binding transcriptional regulator [Paraglaciecola aquimarina]
MKKDLFLNKQGVTIHDVAAYAGVSSMTVSRVVNNSDRVSDKMRKRIEDVIKELNYIPNLAARAARSGVQRIGIIFTNPDSSNLGGFLMGALASASSLGCELLIEPLVAHPSPMDALQALIDKGVHGVILPPPICDSLDVHQLARKNSVMVLSFASASPKLYSPAVLIDDFSGACAMTHYLIQLGHEKIAFIRGNESHSPAKGRYEGFVVAMNESNIKINDDWVLEGDFSYKRGMQLGKELLDKPKNERPTAIFACNDDMATAIIAVAHGLGLKVPEDISIAGFDDTAIASAVWPQLTTIHQPIKDMAARAVKLLDELIKSDGKEQKVNHFIAPFELKERGSTAPLQK